MLGENKILMISTLFACALSSGCVTQVATAPVQVASQSAQTAGQTAGQAAQVVSLSDVRGNNSGPVFQASAASTETTTVKKTQRNNP